ncbi:hypothetical protein ACWCQQ_36555 [Streptomyces sp. NPDC002143]
MSDDHIGHVDDHGHTGDDHGHDGGNHSGSHGYSHGTGYDQTHHGSRGVRASSQSVGNGSDTGFITAGTVLEEDWLTITGTAVVTMVAGTFVQSFVTNLGERAAEEATARSGTYWKRARLKLETKRGRTRREAEERQAERHRTVEEFRSLTQGLIELRGDGSGVLHLSGPDSVAVLEIRPGLPLAAIRQIPKIDLGSQRVTGRTIVWASQLPGYPEGVWIERGSGRFRHVWTGHERWARIRL